MMRRTFLAALGAVLVAPLALFKKKETIVYEDKVVDVKPVHEQVSFTDHDCWSGFNELTITAHRAGYYHVNGKTMYMAKDDVLVFNKEGSFWEIKS